MAAWMVIKEEYSQGALGFAQGLIGGIKRGTRRELPRTKPPCSPTRKSRVREERETERFGFPFLHFFRGHWLDISRKSHLMWRRVHGRVCISCDFLTLNEPRRNGFKMTTQSLNLAGTSSHAQTHTLILRVEKNINASQCN